ncbi:DUF4494 domain-containing protein [Hoylesella timonensis]|uniref:DUF4494 domain-containing protein n=1 Tax=Hoylesella timonensis TaxID=386414 RepID=UPI00242C5DBF|nr:DUF4494 domain-containing protein [Hoylesella timonensis]
MRTRNANWFETSVQYERQGEDGLFTKVRETYVIDAFTFGEAEKAITQEMSSFSSGEFVIKNITPATYGEIFFSDGENDDKWYKAKLMFITIDEEKGKEKRTAVNYLVQANSVAGALKNIEEVFSTSVLDFTVANIAETKIMDVFEHEMKPQADDRPEMDSADATK